MGVQLLGFYYKYLGPFPSLWAFPSAAELIGMHFFQYYTESYYPKTKKSVPPKP